MTENNVLGQQHDILQSISHVNLILKKNNEIYNNPKNILNYIHRIKYLEVFNYVAILSEKRFDVEYIF